MRVLVSLVVLFVHRGVAVAIRGNDGNFDKDADNHDTLDGTHGERHLSIEKTWFSRLKQLDETGLLKRCYKRTLTPESGMACGRQPKICFFGDQDCPSVGLHPISKCSCNNNVWTCEEELCPTDEVTCTESVAAANDPNCPIVNTFDALIGLPCPKVDRGTGGARRNLLDLSIMYNADYSCVYDAHPRAEFNSLNSCYPGTPFYPACHPKWGCLANGCCPNIVCFCKSGVLDCDDNSFLPFDTTTAFPSEAPVPLP